MVGCWLAASISAALASEPHGPVSEASEIELADFHAGMRRQIHDSGLLPYITGGDARRPSLVATLDGRPLRHAELARLIGDEERAREIERMAARDKRMLYSGLAMSAGSLVMSLTTRSVPGAAAAVALSGAGLALVIPASIPGPKQRATRYAAEAIEARLPEASSADGEL